MKIWNENEKKIETIFTEVEKVIDNETSFTVVFPVASSFKDFEEETYDKKDFSIIG